MRELRALLQTNLVNGTLLPGLFGIMDAWRMTYAEKVDAEMQNAYFDGYNYKLEITNIFVWNFYGEGLDNQGFQSTSRCSERTQGSPMNDRAKFG